MKAKKKVTKEHMEKDLGKKRGEQVLRYSWGKMEGAA